MSNYEARSRDLVVISNMENEPLLTKITIADQAAESSSGLSTPTSTRFPALKNLRFFPSSSRDRCISSTPFKTPKSSVQFLPTPSFGHLHSDSEYKDGDNKNLRRLRRRSSSAPPIFTEERERYNKETLFPKRRRQFKFTREIVGLAVVGLIVYVIVVVIVFVLRSDDFEGHQTISPIDALYFTVVTLCTIGYGDIVPDTTFTKLFTCVFILVGFGFIDILLNGLVSYALDTQEQFLLGPKDENQFNAMVRRYIMDKKKGRMRIRTKVGLALGVVIVCLGAGTVAAHLIENYSWVDSFYLSVTSVTTVGYGDYNFQTTAGRCFAVVWLLVSTLAVARAFLYLTEFRIDKRNRMLAEEALERKITRGDFVSADMDHDGSIRKSEYVIFKLKQMGKITEKDILHVCNQFDNSENSYSGKITLGGLNERDKG